MLFEQAGLPHSVETLFSELAARAPELSAKFGRREHFHNTPFEQCGVVLGHKEAGVAVYNRFGNSAVVGCDHRQARRCRFDDNGRQAFRVAAPGGDAWSDKECGGLQQWSEIERGYLSTELYRTGNARFSSKPLQRAAQRPIAADDQTCIGKLCPDSGEGFEQDLGPLLLD